MEEGTVQGDIEACLVWVYFVIVYATFMVKYAAFWKNVPRFLKSSFHIPEEGHLGLASLDLVFLDFATDMMAQKFMAANMFTAS